MRPMARAKSLETIADRIVAVNWQDIAVALSERGYATTGPLLTPAECADMAALYTDAARFRSRVIMQRHAFGRGEYQYFSYPLPKLVAELRRAIYPHLAPVANGWAEAFGQKAEFPARLDDYLARCHAAGQQRPT